VSNVSNKITINKEHHRQRNQRKTARGFFVNDLFFVHMREKEFRGISRKVAKIKKPQSCLGRNIFCALSPLQVLRLPHKSTAQACSARTCNI